MSLAEHLARRIAADGPLSVADYMTECLLHPAFGYYTTRAPFGAEGDFITAPEISQMFGEVIGLCLAQAWVDQGRPTPFTLAELGPGRGTLMADVLRACARVPGFSGAARVSLLEASPALRAVQADTLNAHAPVHLDSVDALPDGPLFLVANEFFDALPVRQFVRDTHHWRERRVGLGAGGALTFGLGPATPQPVLTDRLDDTGPGDLVEIRAAASPVMAAVGARIDAHGGCGLIIDYGDWRSLGDTLQAVRAHETRDVLQAPGFADLTAHVDFEALAGAATCAVTRLTPQGVFLERLGITARAQALAQDLHGAALDTHIAAHRRLTHPDEMGNLFKVLGLFPKSKRPPPGLEI